MKKVSLVVVTGDRGLCGGYNSQIIKSTTKRISKLESQGIQVSFEWLKVTVKLINVKFHVGVVPKDVVTF